MDLMEWITIPDFVTMATTLDQNLTENTSSTGLPNEGSAARTDIINLLSVRVICFICYAVIFVLGISGNSLVILVVLRNKSMQTITNIFITNLAFSDVMMCLLAVPFTPISAYLDDWVFGKPLCRIVPMTLGISVYVSTLTSMAIAVDRYFVIVHPFRARMKTSICLLLIAAVWVTSVSISLPLGIYQTVTHHRKADGSVVVICHENWPQETARQFFAITSLVLQYLVPCSIITLCYTEVSLKLRMHSMSRKGLISRTRLREEQDIRRKRRTNKMLIAMVSIFVCCWLPLNAVQITRDYFPKAARTSYFNLIFFVAHIVAMSSTIYNPFLYAWMNDVFRTEFRLVLPCLFPGDDPRKLTQQQSTYTLGDTRTSQAPFSPTCTLSPANPTAPHTLAHDESESTLLDANEGNHINGVMKPGCCVESGESAESAESGESGAAANALELVKVTGTRGHPL